MAYRIELKPKAAKQLADLPQADRRRVAGRIDALADDPRPPSAKKLKGVRGLYRLRAGRYRILYQVRRKVLLVLVLRIQHRRDVYRRIEDL